jgi:hypothetical protein
LNETGVATKLSIKHAIYNRVKKSYEQVIRDISYTKEMHSHIQRDLGFDIFVGLKTRQRTLNLFSEKRRIKELSKQLRNGPGLERLPGDYRELRRMIKELPFFRRANNEPQFTDEEAMEVVRHVGVKYFPSKRHIYLPEDKADEMYFILRGKVLAGVSNGLQKRASQLISDKYVERKHS